MLFCVALPLGGCGGEKYMEYDDGTVVFDIRKDSVFMDGVLYPDLYRELNGKIQHETNPLYDMGIKRIEAKTRKLKEQGKCEKTYQGHMTVGKRKIKVERCSDSPEAEMQVHIRVDGDVSGRVLREVYQVSSFVFSGISSIVLDRNFQIPLASTPTPSWALPRPFPNSKCLPRLVSIRDSLLRQDRSLTEDSLWKKISAIRKTEPSCEEKTEEPVKSYMELSLSYSNSDSVYFAQYRRRPPSKSLFLEQDPLEKIQPGNLQKRLQREYEGKTVEEREYPIVVIVQSDAWVQEPLKAAETALQSGLKISIGFTYTSDDYR